ncbi:hypothetical protein Q5P01_005140 [Channa striata]|uniref:Uncharacterized protein n=1 Tax=Channa striata TaxID=64152 RepID=A0AA88T108_CHASR|nr:hypothetical protein Q5P01_005140 [Channa striata]
MSLQAWNSITATVLPCTQSGFSLNNCSAPQASHFLSWGCVDIDLPQLFICAYLDLSPHLLQGLLVYQIHWELVSDCGKTSSREEAPEATARRHLISHQHSGFTEDHPSLLLLIRGDRPLSAWCHLLKRPRVVNSAAPAYLNSIIQVYNPSRPLSGAPSATQETPRKTLQLSDPTTVD